MTRLQRFVGAVCGVALLGGCGFSSFSDKSGLENPCNSGQIGQAINSTGPVPAGCTKIEGSNVRKAPQVIPFEGGTVTITSFQFKSDSPGDAIGFEFTSTAPVAFAVKAGGNTYLATSSPWVHPGGTSGPEANGISNITFCPEGGADGGTTNMPPPGETTECDPGGGNGGGAGLPDGATCASNSQCASDECKDGVCEGGPGGSGLPDGATCTSNSQCASDECKDGVCEGGPGGSGLPGGATCTSNSQCASGACTNGVCEGGTSGGSDLPNGSICTSNSQCASDSCVGGVCEAGGGGGALLPPGSTCSSNGQCLSQSCTNALCEGSGVGEPCTQASDCAAQLTCVQNVCQGGTIN